MNWLERIRQKPQREKLKIIWTVVVIVFVLLVLLWIVTSRISKNQTKDTTLFQTIGQGFHNIKANYHK